KVLRRSIFERMSSDEYGNVLDRGGEPACMGRIAVSVIVLLLLVVAVVGGYGYAQQRELSAQTVSIKLNSAYERVLEELKARERIATALAQSIANYPGVAERLDKFDRGWLL